MHARGLHLELTDASHRAVTSKVAGTWLYGFLSTERGQSVQSLELLLNQRIALFGVSLSSASAAGGEQS